jgi:MFS family permease
MGFMAVFGSIGFGRFGYSAILPTMQKALDMSSAVAGLLASWNLAGYVLMAAIGGMLASLFGPRLVVGIGVMVTAFGMFLTGLADGVVGASAARFVTGIGSGMVLVPSVALMSSWFEMRRRGMASGIVSSGSSLALIITGPVVPQIIAAGGADGWRSAWYFFAVLCAVVGVLTFIIQRNRPYRDSHERLRLDPAWQSDCMARQRVGTVGAVARTLESWSVVLPDKRTKPHPRVSMSGMRAVLRSRYAWHMGFVYMAFGFAYMIYFTFFQKRLTADLGLSGAMAGNLFLIIGVGSLICGVLWGSISDRIGRGRAIALNCLLQAIAAALFAWWPSVPGLAISALIFGLTSIAVPGIVGAGCGDQYGPVMASASLGFVTIFLGLGQVLGPYLAGKMADVFGTLTYSYLLAGGVFLAGSVLSAFLVESGWKSATRRLRSGDGVTPPETRTEETA